MQSKYADPMMEKIKDAVYAAFMQKLLDDGRPADEAHRCAMSMTETGIALLRDSWLTLEWLPQEPLHEVALPDEPNYHERLRRLLHGSN